MSTAENTLRILEKTNLDREIEAFLIDRRARGLSPETIRYYDQKLTLFRQYVQAGGLRKVEAITSPVIRRFLLELGRTHTAGGPRALERNLLKAIDEYNYCKFTKGWM